jgi:hypothetical protein
MSSLLLSEAAVMKKQSALEKEKSREVVQARTIRSRSSRQAIGQALGTLVCWKRIGE